MKRNRLTAIAALFFLPACGLLDSDGTRALAPHRIDDRSAMEFDELLDHYRKVHRVARWGGDAAAYVDAVQVELLAKAPWLETDKRLIRSGRIRLGFTIDQVHAALGLPEDARVLTTAQGSTAQLTYPRYMYDYAYDLDQVVVLEQGRVTSTYR